MRLATSSSGCESAAQEGEIAGDSARRSSAHPKIPCRNQRGETVRPVEPGSVEPEATAILILDAVIVARAAPLERSIHATIRGRCAPAPRPSPRGG